LVLRGSRLPSDSRLPLPFQCACTYPHLQSTEHGRGTFLPLLCFCERGTFLVPLKRCFSKAGNGIRFSSPLPVMKTTMTFPRVPSYIIFAVEKISPFSGSPIFQFCGTVRPWGAEILVSGDGWNPFTITIMAQLILSAQV